MIEQRQVNTRHLRARFGWLVHTPLHPQWLMPRRNAADALRACRGTVLDIGAADRRLSDVLNPESWYLALDYPTTAIALYGARPDVFADARRLPFADGSIDAIACFEVLEHVRDPDAVIREIARVLVPGGVVDMSMPFLYPVHDAPYDFQRWTSHKWAQSLADAGLHVEHLKAANHPVHAAAVLAGLALTGPLQALRGWKCVPFLLLAGVLVSLINLGAWLLARAWPRWDAMTTTNRVLARKPL